MKLTYLVVGIILSILISSVVGNYNIVKSDAEMNDSYDLLSLESYTGGRSLVLETFFGFESGTTDEGTTTLGTGGNPPSVDAGDDHNSVETYRLVLTPDTGDWCSAKTTVANDMIMSFYFKITGTNPAPALNFFYLEESKNDNYLRITVDNNVLYLYNATNSFLDTSPTITANTWHRMDIWLESGDPGNLIIYVDDVEFFNEVNEDFAPDSGTDIDMCFGTHGVGGASPTTVYIASGYMYSGGTGIGDFLGDFEIIGPYQNRVNSNSGDFGANLDVGTWQNCGETPGNDANTGKYTGADDSGGVTTHTTDNGATPGPHGDSRITSDVGIKGASWLFRAKASAGGGTSNLWMKYGTTGYNDITTDHTIQSVMSFNGNWQNKLIVSESNCPSTNDYFQYGFRSRGILASDGELADAWCFILYTEPVGVTLHLNNCHINNCHLN